MGPFDALNHLVNLLLPAVGVAAIAAALAKLLWWRALAPVAWWRLALWAGSAGVAVTVGGLVLFGRDGRMATYGAMVGATALALWWVGFGTRRS